MGSDSSNPPATTQPQELDQGLERLQQRLAQLTRAQASIRRWTLVAIFAMVAQTLLFGWALYGWAEKNFFDKDRVLATLTPRLEAMYPSIRDEAATILREVGPVYTEKAFDSLQTSMPDLLEGLEKELRQLALDLPKDTRQALDLSLNRVAKRLEPDIQAVFPALADPQALDRLTRRFEARVHEEFGRIGLKLDTMYVTEARKVWSALMALSPKPQGTLEKVDLERQLLHHLIMLADHELLHAGAPDSATEVFVQIYEAGDPQAIPTAQ